MSVFSEVTARDLSPEDVNRWQPKQGQAPEVTIQDITYSRQNDLIRGLTKEGMFFQKIIKETGTGTPNKDSYSAWVCESRLQEQIKVKRYEYHEVYKKTLPGRGDLYTRKVLKFGPIFFLPPHIRVGDKTYPLTPTMCYLLKISYMFEVLMVMNIYEYQCDKNGKIMENIDDPCEGKLLQSSEPISIGRVPAMVRSKTCNLYKLNERQLMAQGEDLREHGGYFIIDGLPKIIQMGENSKLNSYVFRTDVKTDKKLCTITADNKKGSIVTTLETSCAKKNCVHQTVDLLLNNLKTLKNNRKISEKMNVIRALRLYIDLKIHQDKFRSDKEKKINDDDRKKLEAIVGDPYQFREIVFGFLKDDGECKVGTETRIEKCKRAFNNTVFEALFNAPVTEEIRNEFASVMEPEDLPGGKKDKNYEKGMRYWSTKTDWVILKRKIEANKKHLANEKSGKGQKAEKEEAKRKSEASAEKQKKAKEEQKRALATSPDSSEKETVQRKVTEETQEEEMKNMKMLNNTMLHCLDSSLLSHEESTDPMRKVKSIAMMVAQMLEYMVGIRRETKRDDWDEKRQKTAAKLCEQLMRGFTKNFINGMTSAFDKPTEKTKPRGKNTQKLGKEDFNIECLKSLISQPQQITNGFIASFKGPTWGIHTVNVKESPVQAHEESTYTHQLADLDSINSAVNRKVKSQLVRGLQLNQWGFGDPSANPDNINTGIKKEKAITAMLSTYTSEKIIIKHLNAKNEELTRLGMPNLTKENRGNEEKEITSPFVLNGVFRFFCDPQRTMEQLRIWKREGKLNYQTSIFFDEHNYVLVHTDEGRLIRPVFVVEKDERGKLIPKAYKKFKLNGEETTYLDYLNKCPKNARNEALKLGVIEYIDAREQNNARIALTKNEIDEYMRDHDRLINFISEKEEKRKIFEKNLRKKINNIDLYDSTLTKTRKGATFTENGRTSGKSWDLFYVGENELKSFEELREIVESSLESVKRSMKRGNRLSDNSQIVYAKLLSLESDLKENQSIRNEIASMSYELKVQKESEYHFMEISPCVLHGPILNLAPYLSFQQGPRQNFQHKMGQQGMDMAFTNYENRFQDNAKILQTPSRPLVTTQADSALYTDAFPNTVTLQMAQYPIAGSTIEDSFGIALNSRHKIDIVHQFVIEKTFKPNLEKLTKPIPRENEDPDKYMYLTRDGLPMIGASLQTGDVILGVSSTPQGQRSRNTSIVLGSGQYGTVAEVYVSNSTPLRVVIVVHKYRTLQIPDKLSSRYSQKGTDGFFYRNSMLPFNKENGMISEMFTNPHSVPRRMTGGYIIEPLASTEAALTGIRRNASPYEPSYFEQIVENLANTRVNDENMDPQGYSKLILPFTGKETNHGVFSGPVAIQPLNHLGPGKLQIRGLSEIKKVWDKQPPKGKLGGRKMGEMERNALAGYGVSNILIQLMINYADGCQMPFCKTCGRICYVKVRSTFSNVSKEDASSSVLCTDCISRDEETQTGGKGSSVPVRTAHKNPYVYNLLFQINFAMLFDMRVSFRQTEKTPVEDLAHGVEEVRDEEMEVEDGEKDRLEFEEFQDGEDEEMEFESENSDAGFGIGYDDE